MKFSNFILVNTNKERKGKETIMKVKALKESDPQKFDEIIGGMGDISEEIIECLSQSPVDNF